METLSRRPIQLLKGQDNTVIALCDDGSIWTGRISYSLGQGVGTKWVRVPDVPKLEES